MKRVILAAALGLGILSFTMAGSANHPVVSPGHQMKYDTIPHDTTQPTPKPDTTRVKH